MVTLPEQAKVPNINMNKSHFITANLVNSDVSVLLTPKCSYRLSLVDEPKNKSNEMVKN
jgi:hypothetical protein